MAKIADVIAAPAVNFDITKMVSSSMDPGNDAWWVLYGPSGHGKTTAIASASADFPDKLPAKAVTKLSGIGIVQFDRDGVASLRACNLDVPTLNFSNRTTIAAIREGIDMIPAFVDHYKIHTLAIDTFTSLDTYTVADLQPKFGSKFGLYQTVLAEHGQTLKTLRGLSCMTIFNCHSKAKSQFKDDGEFKESAVNRSLATETPGDFSISMDLSGQTKNFIRSQCSTIMPIVAEKLGNREPDYAIYPNGYQGKFEYKNRYRCFQNKEAPNLYRLMSLVKGDVK